MVFSVPHLPTTAHITGTHRPTILAALTGSAVTDYVIMQSRADKICNTGNSK